MDPIYALAAVGHSLGLFMAAYQRDLRASMWVATSALWFTAYLRAKGVL